MDSLKCLSELKELKKINVKGNPFVEQNENYKDELFKLLSNVECIDSVDKNGKEVEESIYDDEEEEGEEGGEFEDDEGEEFDDDDDLEGEEFEDDGEEDDEDVEKPNKKQKK